MKNILNLQYYNLNDIIRQHKCSKIFIEIGCGNGTFLLEQSKAHPRDLIFGFDVSSLSVLKSAKLLANNQVDNAFVLKFDARFLGNIFDFNSIDVVYMNYPIPWIRKPKRRNHRVVTNRFVRELSGVLKPNGKFRMISDSKWYIDYVAGKFLSTQYFKLYKYNESKEPFINTKYEKKWISEGRTLYWLEITNVNDKLYSRKDEKMPHIFLEMVYEDKVLNIHNENFIENDNGYVYKKAYKGKEDILIKTISVDDGFDQNYFIKIVKRDGNYMVKLDEFTKPIITESVKKSIFNFRDFINKEDEDGKSKGSS